MTQSLTELRHARSKNDFPFLNLEDGEYVELSITRAKIGLLIIWFFEIVSFLLLTLILVLFDNGLPAAANTINIAPSVAATSFLRIVIFILYGALVISGLVGTKVYLDNKMYITNKRAIQIASNALFHKSTNVIELSKIEDVSFKQAGIFDYLFHLGTIRMSTVGDETTYTFRYVETPTDEIQTISHLVFVSKDSNSKKD